MTPFRFRLERVLAWRRTQMEIAEAKFQQRMRMVGELKAERARIEAAGIGAEVQVRSWSPLSGSDLAALANYRQYVAFQETRLAVRQEDARREAEEQRKALLETRKRVQLLERLRKRRLAEWQAAADRELEQLAAESFLARLSREGT